MPSLPLILSFLSFLSAAVSHSSATSPLPYTLASDARAPLPYSVPALYGTLIFWDYHTWLQEPALRPDVHAAFPFVREIELFTATGGCYPSFPNCTSSRDLFNDPADPSSGVNASALVAAVSNILAANFSAYIVTANVPVALSADPHIGTFGVNNQPPSSLPAYRDYIAAIAGQLVDALGLDAVRSRVRWGVFTEYNNPDWLVVPDPSDYFALYAYTACALESVIGAGHVSLGGHACTQCSPPHGGSAWNASLLLEYAASAPNPCTGGTGAPLSFIADSFYEVRPGQPGDLSWFSGEVDQLINASRALGMDGRIAYGVDEGRILLGPESEGGALALTTRAVGDSYQASFDALLFTIMVERNMSWYARWGVDSNGGNGLWTGGAAPVDVVSGNLARLCDRMVGGRLLSVTNGTSVKAEAAEALAAAGVAASASSPSSSSASSPSSPAQTLAPVVDAAASYHAGQLGGLLRVLAFNHYPALATDGAPDVNATVRVCGFLPAPSPSTGARTAAAASAGEANITRIDDGHAQFWPTWLADRLANNITDVNPGWSAYSDSISLGDAQNRSYWAARAPAYQALAALVTEPLGGDVGVGADGCVAFALLLPPHGVALVEVVVGPVAGG